MTDRHEEMDGYTVTIVSFAAEVDGAPLLKGLKDDVCQRPHWGYVVEGTATFTFADHVETFEAGDAFYVPPGHSPAHSADSELVMFSPTRELRKTEEGAWLVPALTARTARAAARISRPGHVVIRVSGFESLLRYCAKGPAAAGAAGHARRDG